MAKRVETWRGEGKGKGGRVLVYAGAAKGKKIPRICIEGGIWGKTWYASGNLGGFMGGMGGRDRVWHGLVAFFNPSFC